MQTTRGFSRREFETRTSNLQRIMASRMLDGILLTTEANIRYFSGFVSQFWESPTRPWFLVIPAAGKPVAVIPEIGVSGMTGTWIEDIRSWSSPNPGDDGLSLLAALLNELPKRYGRIGATLGLESHLRMPLNDFCKLQGQLLTNSEIIDIAGDIHTFRSIKSAAEIAKIRSACDAAFEGFQKIPGHAKAGQSERVICKQMHIDMIGAGADTVKYLTACSGQGGYESIIMGPTDTLLERGDILMIDTGCMFDGYYCDFDRHFAFGKVSSEAQKVYEVLSRAGRAGFAAARPGATTADIFQAMWSVIEQNGGKGSSIGRMGHGLGMQLTEWPSINATAEIPLVPGMVLTLEPGMSYGPGKIMVQEENIVITENGAEYLAPPCPESLPVID